MLQEQQQRILGYFIEEAKDHLNTIEHGLLNLNSTLQDPEMLNELFRAAHSVKGGSAMLGFNSIQQTAHRLEDYFKVFKECANLQIDQKLESLLLRVFDTLQALITQLEESLALPDHVVAKQMAEVEPIFTELNQHLQLLINQAGGNIQLQQTDASHSSQPTIESLIPVFQGKVVQQLREMLQLFKQAETPQTRQQLQECCQQLVQMGEQLKLAGWCNLCQSASGAIANHKNTYRTLAPVVIKEIKQSQELVVAGRANEIKTSSQLQSLARGLGV